MNSLSPLLLAASLLGGAEAPSSVDNPRAIIQRAIKASGLDVKLPPHGLTYRIKGHTTVAGGGLNARTPLEGDMFIQPPQRVKMRLTPKIADTEISTTVVLDGDRSWAELGGTVTDLDPQIKESMQRAYYLDRITDFTPLLTDRSFTLAALGESKVDDRPVVGVKVSCKGHEDVSLYFDRKTGLLVKYSYEEKESPADRPQLHEVYLRDYRVPDLLAAPLEKLRAAQLDTTDAALLDYLRKQTARSEDVERAGKLIRQLGDDSFQEREKAMKELLALGGVALPLLEQAAKSDDPEVVRRAHHCLQKIKASHREEVSTAVIQVLTLRRPAGLVEALLAYLPAADARTAGEVRAALAALAEVDGKPHPVLLRALADRDPVRKAAAEAVLGKDGGAYLKQPGRRLYYRPPIQAMKTISHRDGKPYMELNTYDIQLFNALEDGVFARPKSRGP